MVKQFLAILMIVCAGLVAQAQLHCTPVATLSGNITSNRLLDRDTVYLIDDCVYVTNNSTLTIESGTVIEFQNNSILMILKDGLIDAVGTPTAPIVMTANVATPGMGRGPVTNAGLVIVGDARINESPLTLTCSYVHTAGSADNHSSGNLEYVQFHYLDGPSSPTYMANALSLVGVGDGTTLEHIQITNSGGNGLGILGGHPVITNLYVENTAQNDIYVSFGAVATLTEVLTLHKDCDLKSVAGTNSVYIENHPSIPASSPPEVMVTIDQSTFLRPLHCGCEPDEDFQHGIVLNNNAGLDLKNSVLSGFNASGLFIEDQQSADNTDNGRVLVNYTSFTNNSLNFDYNSSITWVGNACGNDMDEWIEGTGPGYCTQDGNQFNNFILGYSGSICEDFCEETPEFVTTGSTTIAFIDGSETIRRGALGETNIFTYITPCPKDAVYCTPVPLFKTSPSLQVYPNPAAQQAFVAFEAAGAGTAEIVVRELVTGRILYQGTLIISQQGEQQVSVPVSGWKEGVYPVQIKTQGQLFQGKISIQ